jgi:hypothetical protein
VLFKDELYEYSKEGIFSYQGKFERIDFPPVVGLSGYYSPNLTREEIDTINGVKFIELKQRPTKEELELLIQTNSILSIRKDLLVFFNSNIE